MCYIMGEVWKLERYKVNALEEHKHYPSPILSLLGSVDTAEYVFLGAFPLDMIIIGQKLTWNKVQGLVTGSTSRSIHPSGVSVIGKGRYNQMWAIGAISLHMTEMPVKTITSVQILPGNKTKSAIGSTYNWSSPEWFYCQKRQIHLICVLGGHFPPPNDKNACGIHNNRAKRSGNKTQSSVTGRTKSDPSPRCFCCENGRYGLMCVLGEFSLSEW